MGKKLEILKPQSIEVLLGDRNVAIVFDLNAFSVLEEAYGSVEQAFEKLQNGNVKIKDVLTFLKASMVSSAPDITEQEIGQCLNAKNMPEFMELITKAIAVALPSTEETKTKEGKN